MQKAVRSQIISGLVILIIGGILLVTATISQPHKVVHSGYITLKTQEQLDQFSNAIILHNISSVDYQVYGDDFPYTVHLDKIVTRADSSFDYGNTRWATVWRIDMVGVGTLIWWVIGWLFCILGLVYMLMPILWPMSITHTLFWGGKWIPKGFDRKRFNERIDKAYEETLKETKPDEPKS